MLNEQRIVSYEAIAERFEKKWRILHEKAR